MSNIGIFHYKVGGTDGVSLEIDKWKLVLEEMGHTVHLCAGDLGTVEGTRIEALYHHTEDAERLNRNTFRILSDYASEAEYAADLERITSALEKEITAFVEQFKIDLIVPQNVWSVAMNPAVAVAVARVMRKKGLRALAHHHDFYWERVTGCALTCRTAIGVADKFLPPRDASVRHVVINKLAQKELKERKGLDAHVIPNIFDTDEEGHWKRDDYNADLRERIGLRPNDVMLLQATRIVERKGIELAIDFVKALDTPARRAKLEKTGLYDGRPFNKDSRFVLVLAGYAEDAGGEYLKLLKDKIKEAGVHAVFCDEMIAARRQTVDGVKQYALWDAYVPADFVTYPSLWEGWGNQLLEALCARQPVLLYEYPVYTTDIAYAGFETVSLGAEISGKDARGLSQVAPAKLEKAADEAIVLLSDKKLRDGLTQRNFERVREHFSVQALRKHLAQLMGSF